MISPIITNLDSNSYLINRTKRNIVTKKNYTNNISFGCTKNEAARQINPAIRQIDMEALMQYSDGLIKDLKTFCARESKLKTKAQKILHIAKKQMSDILREHGFNPGIFNPNYIGDKQSQIDKFFELIKNFGGRSEKVNRGNSPNSFFEKFALVSLGCNPDDVYNNTYQTITLKSKKYPKAKLDIFCTPNRKWGDRYASHKEEYLPGIKHFKHSLIESTDENLSEYNKESNLLRFKTPELEFTGCFCGGSDENKPFWFVLMNHPIIDHRKNLRFEYSIHSRLSKIVQPDNCTTFDLSNKKIKQNFPEKNMCVEYSLSDDLERVESITLKNIPNNKIYAAGNRNYL